MHAFFLVLDLMFLVLSPFQSDIVDEVFIESFLYFISFALIETLLVYVILILFYFQILFLIPFLGLAKLLSFLLQIKSWNLGSQ